MQMSDEMRRTLKKQNRFARDSFDFYIDIRISIFQIGIS